MENLDARKRRFWSYLQHHAALTLAIAEEDPQHPDETKAEALRDVMEPLWDEADEDTRNAIRWALTATDLIEDHLIGAVPGPPWLEAGGEPDANRTATAEFLATPPRDPRVTASLDQIRTAIAARLKGYIGDPVTEELQAKILTKMEETYRAILTTIDPDCTVVRSGPDKLTIRVTLPVTDMPVHLDV